MTEIIESTLYITPDIYTEKVNQENFKNPPARADGNLSLQQFFDLMFYVLNIEKPGLVFAPAWPQYLLPDTPEYKKTMDNPTTLFKDTITYMITREEPGSVGGDKQPFGGRREVTPKIREVQNVIGNEKSSVVYGQWFDTLVQFDTWTLTNWEAENLSLWFKRYMISHRDFFKNRGLSEILFWWRGKDSASLSLRNNLHSRSLVFFVRTEELMSDEDYNVKKFELEMRISTTE